MKTAFAVVTALVLFASCASLDPLSPENRITVVVITVTDCKVYADGELVTVLGFGIPNNTIDTVRVRDGAELTAKIFKSLFTRTVTETARDGLLWSIDEDAK